MKRFALTALAAATLAACGGSDSSAPAAPTPASLSGTVSKGLVLNGNVIVEEMSATGVVLRELGRTVTHATTGTYNFTLPSAYTGGPIQVRVLPKTDGSTTMVCDVPAGCAVGVNFGQTLPLTGAFSMRALLPTASAGSAISAAVTPFTTMAAERAASAPTLNSAAILAAVSEVSQMVGVNVLTTMPVNPAALPADATEEQKVYAAFLVAVGSLAANLGGTGSFSENLATAVAALADDFADGQLDADETFSAADIVGALEDVSTDVPSLDTPALALVTTTLGDQIDGDGNYNPEPSDTATADAVTRAKALIADARTFVESFADLEAPAQAFKGDLDAVSVASDERFVALFDSVSDAMAAIDRAVQASEGPLALGQTYTMDGYTLTLPAATGAQPVTMQVTDNNAGDGMAFSATLNTNITASQFAQLDPDTWLSLGGAGGVTATFTGSASKGGASINFTNLTVTAGPVSREIAGVECDVAEPPAGCDIAPPETLTLAGALTANDSTANMSFTGNVALNAVELTAPENPEDHVTTLQSASLSGNFTGLGRTVVANVTATVNNAADFDFVAFADHEDSFWVQDHRAGDSLGAQQYAGYFGFSSAYYSSFEDQTCFWGYDEAFNSLQRCETGDVLGVATFLMEGVSGAQGVEWMNYYFDGSSSNVSGEIVMAPFESADYFANVTLTGSFSATLPNFGTSTVAFTLNRTQQEAGNVQLAVTRAGRTFTLKALNDATAGQAAFTLSNPDGIKLTVAGEEAGTTGDVTLIEGAVETVLGTLRETDDGLLLISWADGTFESVQ